MTKLSVSFYHYAMVLSTCVGIVALCWCHKTYFLLWLRAQTRTRISYKVKERDKLIIKGLRL